MPKRVAKLAAMDPNEWEVFWMVLKFREEKTWREFYFQLFIL